MKIRVFVFGDGMSHNKDIFSMCPDGSWVQYADQGYWVNSHEREPEFIIMESSGALGRDSIEIFEGDVVSFEAITCTSIPSAYWKAPYVKGQVFVVKRLACGFFLSIPEILDSTLPSQVGHVNPYTFWNHQKSFRVIGNIYENPELITTPI